MKISTPGGKKQDKVPNLPRFISNSIVDLQADQKHNLDESSAPQPTKIVMKEKVKRNSTCQAVCDLINGIIYPAVLLVGISLIQVILGRILRRILIQ